MLEIERATRRVTIGITTSTPRRIRTDDLLRERQTNWTNYSIGAYWFHIFPCRNLSKPVAVGTSIPSTYGEDYFSLSHESLEAYLPQLTYLRELHRSSRERLS